MTVELQTVAYPIFSDLTIVIGLLGGSKSETKNLSVKWNTRRTTITGARLVVVAKTDSWLTDMTVHFNGQQIYRRDWITETGIVSESIDVIALLQNGVNTVVMTYRKPLGGATLVTTVSLEVDFEGSEPSEEPTVFGVPVSTVLIGVTLVGTAFTIGRIAKGGKQ